MQGQANFLYVRYCDDFLVLCNGTRAQAQAMRQELYTFLKIRLKLCLSLEKTKVTHINEGFRFLGFWMQRMLGAKGKKIVKILIPEAARRKYLHKIRQALSPSTHRESVNTKIKALNSIVAGWGHYYQYTSSPMAVFHKLDYQVFWLMTHWLGRKYRCSTPQVFRRFRQPGTLGTAARTLAQLSAIPTKRYQARVIPNPDTTAPAEQLWRDVPFSLETLWRGTEQRHGQADWRDLVLDRDGPICAQCGTVYPEWALELDHRKPRGSFRRPPDADHLENFQLLCTPHHRTKTKQDRQVLSRVR
jgi:RNA-directed DNA polymerase